MTIIRVQSQLESTSAAGAFLAGDKLLNIEKVVALNKKIDAALKKVKVEGKAIGRGGRTAQFEVVGKKTAINKILRARFPRGNKEQVAIDIVEVPRQPNKFRARIQAAAGASISPKLRNEVAKLLEEAQELKPTAVVAIGMKAKTAKYTAAQAKKKENFTFRSRRAVKIALRTRETAASKTLLRVYPKGVLPAALEKQINEAYKACEMHLKKIEAVKKAIQKDRGVVKERKAKDYDAVVNEVRPLLEGMGIAATKIVMARSMMGAQTLLVQLPSKKVMSIGLSDIKAFNAAVKAAKDQ